MVILDSSTTKKPDSAPVQIIGALFEHAGGLESLVAKFKDGGLKEVVESWISSGDNLPISSQQMHGALGADLLEKISTKTGIDVSTLKNQLVQYLPLVIDRLSPDGKLGGTSHD
jgi:uncharacterized protein YidB (DUF937 family)